MKKSEQERMQEFAEAYNKLVVQHGFQIAVTPILKPRDDGSWSIYQQTGIVRVPKPESTSSVNPKG